MRPETLLQRRIKRLLEKLGYRVVHVPNGAVLAGNAKQRAIQMNSLKANGLTVGFPDLLVYGGDRKLGHIEVKLEGEAQSENQVKVQGWLEAWGHKYAVCRSLEDVPDTLEAWGWA